MGTAAVVGTTVAAGTVEAAGPEAVEGVTGLAMEAEAPAWEADCAGTAHPYRSGPLGTREGRCTDRRLGLV